MRKALVIVCVGLNWMLTAVGLQAEDAGLEEFRTAVKPFLTAHCVNCHGPEKSEADFRVDSLSGLLADGKDARQWEEVLHRLNKGEMPPEDAPQPSSQQVSALTKWVDSQTKRAIAAKVGAGGEVVLRRLNRFEYNHTVSDLMGIDFREGEFFPDDAATEGFDNIGQALQTSPVLMRAYLSAADAALDKALWFDPKPELLHAKFDRKEDLGYVPEEKLFGGAGYQIHDGNMVVLSYWSNQSLSNKRLDIQTPGKYRVKIRAHALRSPDETLKLQVSVGNFVFQSTVREVGLFYLPNEKPFEINEVVALRPKDGIKYLWYNGKKQNNAAVKARKEGLPYDGPGVVIESIEVEGPLFLQEGWPKRSHRLVLGEKDPETLAADDVPAIIENFATRAFRRPSTAADVDPIVKFVQSEMDAGVGFEEAIRSGLKVILCSPKFLFLYETEKQFDDYMLASRLSYYLWSSMPDDELLNLAKQNKLHEPEILKSQAGRMLKDLKASRFIDNFTGQWLDLRKIGEMRPDHAIYPRYGAELEAALGEETRHFFAEILRENLHVDQFLDSDFLMLNELMATHYDIEGVKGSHFRRVPTPPDSHRGGLLAQASVLNVTSNGTTTSPVVRGAWVLERIFGETPPPPPPDIPVIVPDIRGATTIREQLAKHRTVASCNSCHRKIDPLGFGLENFDVIGQWRSHYKVRKGPIDKPGGWYGNGPAVDAADQLHTGEKFTNADSLKAVLLTRRADFHRCLTRKLMTYAYGRSLEWTDRPTVEELSARLAQEKYGLQDLVVDIVLTKQFSSP